MVEGRGKEASGMGWEMMPMPSLLAEPSQPRARRRRFFGGESAGEGDIFVGFLVVVVILYVEKPKSV